MSLPISFSTIILNFLNTPNISYFFLKKYAHIFREKSPTKEIKYLLPVKDSGVIGPHKSVWINPSCTFAYYSTMFGNLVLGCFPNTHFSRNLLSNSILGNPCTNPFFSSSTNPQKCKWPKRKCHTMASSFMSSFKHFLCTIFNSSLYILFFISTRTIKQLNIYFKYSTWCFIITKLPFSII